MCNYKYALSDYPRVQQSYVLESNFYKLRCCGTVDQMVAAGRVNSQQSKESIANKAITLTNVVESLGMIPSTAGACRVCLGRLGPPFN